MKYFCYISIFLSLLLSACSSSDEPTSLSYTLSSEESEDVVISDSKRDAHVFSTGGGVYQLSISGDFVNIVFDSSVDWAVASYSSHIITVNISRPSSGNEESGHINFTVFNDNLSASGKISVKYKQPTYQDFLVKERKAIDYFLKDFVVATTTPNNIAQFQVGENAPFYYLDDNKNVAMRILSMGDDGLAENGDLVYFRYFRYNLMTYFTTGSMPSPTGNYDSLDNDASFIYNDFLTPSSAQWGKGIQMPLMKGVPYGSRVQLVISSQEGIKDEQAYCIPYLYEITYFLPENPSTIQFPDAKVYIPFFTQSQWEVFGVTSACTWRFFSLPMNKPANYNYGENTATGLGGIFLVSDVGGNALAYDAACPVEAKADITIWLNSETGIARCASCGSEYDLFQLGGFPVSGKAAELHYTLKRYEVHFSGSPYAVISNH